LPSIYHLADVRLGGGFPFLGAGGASHRRQVRETLIRAVDQGLALAPSLVLVTGNLFGTPFPSRELSEFARTQVGRLTAKGIPVLIAAGPLDALYDKTYGAGALAGMDRVSIFSTAPKTVDIPDADITVVGASWGAAPVEADVLAQVAQNRTHTHLVGAAYLDLPEGEDALRGLRRQIARSGAGYVALGGSPVRRDLSTEGVTAWCPGAPELVAPTAGDGAPLLVELGRTTVVTPHRVAKRRFGRFTLQPSAFSTTEELIEAIRALADPNLAAHVRLSGSARPGQFVDIADLQQRLAAGFLALELVDESLPLTDSSGGAVYPELSVAGKLLSLARREMERAPTEEARWRTGAALRLGLALLEGWRPS
jgi:hypothetical protein